jgi:hypothetical protein
MRVFTSGVLLSLVALTAVTSAAGPDPKYKAPRTESGQPDLRGVWNYSSAVPLQRPTSVADHKQFTPEESDRRQKALLNALTLVTTFAPIEAVGIDWLDTRVRIDDLRTSLISYPENGRVPKLVDGVQRMPGVNDIIEILADNKGPGLPPELLTLVAAFQGGKRDTYENFATGERCIFGPNTPFVPGLADNYVQVVQSKEHVVLLTDATRRIIPIDSRPVLGDKLRSWAGDSRGHWEGDTLVVETRNFSARPNSFVGAGNAHDKVVVERFTRTANDRLAYEATVTDAKTFQDKIVLSFPMAKVDLRTYEWACHEGNYSLPNALSGARAEERATAATK